MSLFPGEMTKHNRVAPARTIRSTRYSLTARGRSVAPSRRIPTGKSSFENASGWMRLPVPAAGMIPHKASPSNPRQQLFGPLFGGVFQQHALARCAPDACQLLRRTGDRVHRFLGGPGHQDFLAGSEEVPHTL